MEQNERDIATATKQAFNVRGQLDHRARQRIETVLAALARPQPGEILAAKLHFLGQQCRAISFGNLQGAADLVEQLAGTDQRRRAAASVDAVLERQVRVADCLHELAGDNRQAARGRYAARVFDNLFLDAGFAAH